MPISTLLPLLLLAGALLAAAAGAALRRPRPGAGVALVLLAGAGVLAGVLSPATDGRGAAAALVLVAGALAVLGGGPVTTTVFELVDGRDRDGPSSMRSAGEVLRGGAWIGALERAAVFALLIAGWPDGLLVVLGLKGLGRYPELRNQDHTGTAERFIIGTFTSVLWAAACAAVVHLVLG